MSTPYYAEIEWQNGTFEIKTAAGIPLAYDAGDNPSEPEGDVRAIRLVQAVKDYSLIAPGVMMQLGDHVFECRALSTGIGGCRTHSWRCFTHPGTLLDQTVIEHLMRLDVPFYRRSCIQEAGDV